jgi:hypothetical protein
MCRRLLPIALLALCALWGLAEAQPISVALGVDLSIAPNVDAATGQASYNVKSMDFDLWCQQTGRYSIERCEARHSEDVQAFEDYRSAVERYELDFLKQQQRVDQFQRQISRDPLQNVHSKQDGLP